MLLGFEIEESGSSCRCHVWGNFCLAYDDQELINDRSLLSSFGIKDSDEVCIECRHLRIVDMGLDFVIKPSVLVWVFWLYSFRAM